MKKIIAAAAIAFTVVFAGCGTEVIKTQVYEYTFHGYTYDKVFNATMYALNTSNETVVDANRSAGTIHTQVFVNNAREYDDYYLLTPVNKKEITYSSSIHLQMRSYNDDNYIEQQAEKKVTDWMLGQTTFVGTISDALDKLYGSKKSAGTLNEKALKNIPPLPDDQKSDDIALPVEQQPGNLNLPETTSKTAK